MSRNQTGRRPAIGLALAAVLALTTGCRAELGYGLGPSGPPKDQKLWCEGRLCRWSVQEGEARPVQTWHELDPALALIGPRVRLSRDDTVAAGKSCLFFIIRLDAPEGTSVRLEVDRGADGTVELSETLHPGDTSAEGWDGFLTRFPDDNPREIPGVGSAGEPTRLWIVKEGPGDVQLYPRYVSLHDCPPRADAGP